MSKAIKAADTAKTSLLRDLETAKAERIRKAQGKEGEGERDTKKSGKKRKGVDEEDEWKFEDRQETVFKPVPPPRRLGDVAQAPPKLPKLRGFWGKTGATEGGGAIGGKMTGRSPLNVGQQRLLEVERERVIRMYREMKAAREEAKTGEKRPSGTAGS